MSGDESWQPEPNTGRWWKIWIAATTLLPIVAGALNSLRGELGALSPVLALIGLGLHDAACKRLAPKNSGLYLFLMFGGGVLMATCLFSGCVVFRIHP